MTRKTATIFFLATLASWAVGAQECDLVETDTVSTSGMPGQPLLYGGQAYVAAAGGGIVRVDVSDADDLTAIGAVPTAGEARDLVLELFKRVLVLADGSAGIATFKIAGDGSLVAVGALVTSEAVGTVAAFQNRFLAGGDAGTLYSIRIGDDLAPYEIGSVALGGAVRGIVERSSRAYVALGAAGLARVDLSDPTRPAVLGVDNLGGPVTAIARRDNQLVAAVEGVGLRLLQLDGDALVALDDLELPHPVARLTAWNDRVFAVGPDLGLVEADLSLGTELLAIGSLPLGGASGLALSGNEVFVGRGASGFTAVDAADCANPSSSFTTRVIPAGARAEGASDSFWLTDAALANLSPGVATVSVAYLPKGADNSTPMRRSLALGSGRQMILGDLFSSVFDLSEANGAILVTASHPDVKITSRTYNAAGSEGTYGQFIPALDATEAVTPAAAGVLLQLQENAAFRTNIGVVNLGGDEVELRIRLFDDAGGELGVLSQVVPPYGMNQFNAAYRIVGASTVDSGYAVVAVDTDGGQLLAYASVVDRGSNDPIWVPTQRLGPDSPFNR